MVLYLAHFQRRMDKDGGGSLTEDEFIKVCIIKITLDIYQDRLLVDIQL